MDSLTQIVLGAACGEAVLGKKTEVDTCDDIFEMTNMGSNTYSFDVKYYDGCCGFDEAVAIAMSRLKSEDIE